MNIQRTVKRALRKAGYNVNSLNFQQDTISQTALETLIEMELDLQTEINLKTNNKFAKLSEVKQANEVFYNGFLEDNPNYKAYQLPSDFISYVGCTKPNLDVNIMGDFAIVRTPKHTVMELFDNNDFWFEYEARIPLQKFSDKAETYCVCKLALALVVNLRPDDKVRMAIIREELEKERTKMIAQENLSFKLDAYRLGKMGWRS